MSNSSMPKSPSRPPRINELSWTPAFENQTKNMLESAWNLKFSRFGAGHRQHRICRTTRWSDLLLPVFYRSRVRPNIFEGKAFFRSVHRFI
ncbi:hypothetical protein KFK09_017596 [Dendrobium nobile]|uniref:Uncharacterized protein n=1 Tax=Dendrobium nobile TaxID=94219 RepID=A0A8T3B2S4_DENNO|nr:hypothetical protein KFK09_017596 [Dendrobium nobile]